MTKQAFTLIELLVVVAILGVLAGIAAPQIGNALTRANVARAQADMSALHRALFSYATGNRDMLPMIRQDFYRGAGGGEAHSRRGRLAALTTPIAYIGGIPRDPFAKGGVEDEPESLPPNDVYIYWDEETTKKFRDANAFIYADSVLEFFGSSQRKTNQEGFLLISYGPDRRFGVSDRELPGKASSATAAPRPAHALPPDYNPTNGIQSAGSIYFPGVVGKER